MKDDVLREAPDTGVRMENGTEIARLIETLAQVFYRIDADVNKLRNSRSISTARGLELDRKAREVGVSRPEGEGDDAFRRRALAGRTRARSETVWEDFAEGVLEFLDADTSDVELAVDYEDEMGAVIVNVTSSVIEDSPFSENTIQNYLESMIPMSRRVALRSTDGFQFSHPDTTDEKSGLGWGEGEWTA